MKVSLDACLFGALCQVSDAHTILDIGTGTGLLALMCAQRSHANIDAVELDIPAAKQAQDNVSASPFKHRINIHQQSIQKYQAASPANYYDVIICNPPFFSQHLTGQDPQRNQARHNQGLSFADLATSITHMLKQTGEAWLLLPPKEHEHFLNYATHENLTLVKHIQIHARKNKPSKLGIWVYSKQKNIELYQKNIIVYEENRQEYTQEFQQALSDFYLKL